MSDTLMDFDEAVRRYDPVLGLEVHVELGTATKMFDAAPNVFGAQPNTMVTPTSVGLPGALPVVNARGVEYAIRIGLALGCEIAQSCRFARKNYFYPDLAKDFQTSQSDEPIAYDGALEIEMEDGSFFTIPIERAHMEEDAGKLTHIGATGRIHGADHSVIDYNRAGMPLIEIVTRPILGTGAKAPQVARAYVAHLRDLMRALDVSDVRMEQGSLRCDANVSLAPKGSAELGTRTETKNVNSLRSIERAVTFEMRRQAAILADGGRVTQETRHFHEGDGSTSPGRSKEEAQDYRYFAEPDLVPVAPSAEWIEELRATLPEPPAERRRRLAEEWDIDARTMAAVVAAGALDLIEATVAAGTSPQSARKWWLSELARRANEAGVELDALGVTPTDVAETQAMVDAGELTDKLARAVFDGVIAGEGRPVEVVAGRGLRVVSDDGALNATVEDVIAANPEVAQKIRGGKHQAVGALIGQVMKAMRGQADAARVRELLMEKLT